METGHRCMLFPFHEAKSSLLRFWSNQNDFACQIFAYQFKLLMTIREPSEITLLNFRLFWWLRLTALV